jgi:hypothetical protein
MDDEAELLASDEGLFGLLEFYDQSAGEDREIWLDRVMDWDGATAAQLSRWHATPLAATWVEINLGVTPALAPGRVAGCHRVTHAGRRALKRARGLLVERETAADGGELLPGTEVLAEGALDPGEPAREIAMAELPSE